MNNQPEALFAPSDPEATMLDTVSTGLQKPQAPEEELLFTSPLWARFSFPHRDQGISQLWEVRNGDQVLQITPGRVPTRHGSANQYRVPYGIIPRALMAYLVTTVLHTGDPVVEIGTSQRQFFNLIGVARNPRQVKLAIRQVEALAACNIRVFRFLSEGDVHGVEMTNANIARKVIWAERMQAGKQTEWATKIMLDPTFVEEVANDPMPLSASDLRSLGSSTIAFDVYVWLTYRLWQLNGPTRVTWTQLQQQFGTGYARMRDFRRAFIEALGQVKAVYQDANVSIPDDKDYIILHRSKPRIAPIKPLRSALI